jgi:hypothetical protein
LQRSAQRGHRQPLGVPAQAHVPPLVQVLAQACGEVERHVVGLDEFVEGVE